MTPLFPSESWWTSDPWRTHVTISMSRWGWVSKPVPGATMSSLLTSSSPWWVLLGSQCRLNENECFESSQPMLVLNRSSARRTSTEGNVAVIGWLRLFLLLDGGDLELEDDLLADEDAAGLEGGVPADAPVLAVDRHVALEAHAAVAPRVDGGSGVLEVEGDRLGDALDAQIAGDPEGLGVGLLEGGADEPD